MKVQVSNTNAPCWRDITVKSRVPAQLDILQEMARNISWVWHSEAIEMFRSIDPVLWKSTNGNPVLMLQQINYERLEEIAADKAIMRRINDLYDEFKIYGCRKENRSSFCSLFQHGIRFG